MKVRISSGVRANAVGVIDVDGGVGGMIKAEVVDLDAASVRLNERSCSMQQHTMADS